MASVTHTDSAQSDELLREHRADWIAFTQFVKYGSVAVAVLLVLMAFFLL
ncbi:aa3-type cytochrome c oxidase subunit IV [Azospirillum sp. RWY-5-1]|uniref:Aa3-type cytochrome c oxidase subunit IV n=1 Tax=Azospirillum oleiclasticum TaxID=2735135 RepID=A0ABX2THS5_9PROT|nr:aa3-type cytochrome c oxidase subunit IV [Azospirillum oleiclasticum]NYZ14891.1 aa3-type cytochrome c oxidase subunit IV [Azospirillum oleiclasticum]NYZ22653.1 aa3-type cytochrome c oxidase subunit IV [Azospirillum oleiclasticum]